MFVAKLALAVLIIVGILYGLKRLHRELSGRGNDAGLVTRGIKKTQRDGPNELEKFIADYRAGAVRAGLSGPSMDPAPEHKLGVDFCGPKLTSVAQGPRRLLYLLLKTTLADHHVFPNARLGDFMEGIAKEASARRVDFLIANRGFEAVCAVDVTDREGSAQPGGSELFEQVGLHYVRLTAGSLPRPHEARALVLGAARASRAASA